MIHDPQPASRALWSQHPEVTARVGVLAGTAHKLRGALASGPSLEFPDVSEHNGSINWNDVHGIHLAIIREGFGTTRADYQFKRNWEGVGRRLLLDTGIHRRIVYHYCYPDSAADGVSEAKFMVANMRRMEGEVRDDDGWMGDFEDPSFSKLSPRERRLFVSNFVATAEDHLERHGFAYSYVPWWVEMVGTSYYPSNCRSIVARYASDRPTGAFPFVQRMRAWQHTDGIYGAPPRSVEGIGRCDVNRIINTDLDSFLNFGKKAA